MANHCQTWLDWINHIHSPMHHSMQAARQSEQVWSTISSHCCTLAIAVLYQPLIDHFHALTSLPSHTPHGQPFIFSPMATHDCDIYVWPTIYSQPGPLVQPHKWYLHVYLHLPRSALWSFASHDSIVVLAFCRFFAKLEAEYKWTHLCILCKHGWKQYTHKHTETHRHLYI